MGLAGQHGGADRRGRRGGQRRAPAGGRGPGGPARRGDRHDARGRAARGRARRAAARRRAVPARGVPPVPRGRGLRAHRLGPGRPRAPDPARPSRAVPGLPARSRGLRGARAPGDARTGHRGSARRPLRAPRAGLRPPAPARRPGARRLLGRAFGGPAAAEHPRRARGGRLRRAGRLARPAGPAGRAVGKPGAARAAHAAPGRARRAAAQTSFVMATTIPMSTTTMIAACV
ncbi:MAG: hypothetical protein AVDCRST_MAG13-2893 [uncultured Solirubrobacteraceae bacterium]|uniref:Uncharacterized protein n=1 Tax=uncultured Solirubrobacteraceae bacterium TaxID=1162706 RepID=A0A6J4T3U7_9ACTN|nr:MAG: hypothetical protein AVDCRST_MAG13-2893 [uncultured Solirubrobacteraceae bacterium]